jgi:hypothetical protein
MQKKNLARDFMLPLTQVNRPAWMMTSHNKQHNPRQTRMYPAGVGVGVGVGAGAGAP